jgi:hypothetical protein
MSEIGCRDLYLASFLHCQGVRLAHVEKRGNRSIFFFEASNQANQLVQLYFRDEAVASVRALRGSLRFLKGLASGDIPIPESSGGKNA